jgi:hypothetical protein
LINYQEIKPVGRDQFVYAKPCYYWSMRWAILFLLSGILTMADYSPKDLARALMAAKAADDLQMWPQLADPNRPDIIDLDPGRPEPAFPELHDPNEEAERKFEERIAERLRCTRLRQRNNAAIPTKRAAPQRNLKAVRAAFSLKRRTCGRTCHSSRSPHPVRAREGFVRSGYFLGLRCRACPPYRWTRLRCGESSTVAAAERGDQLEEHGGALRVRQAAFEGPSREL